MQTLKFLKIVCVSEVPINKEIAILIEIVYLNRVDISGLLAIRFLDCLT